MNETQPASGVAVLGSTGTIGVNTLDVIRRNPGRYRVSGLSGGRNVGRMVEQVMEFRPGRVAMADADAARAVERELRARDLAVEVGVGEAGIAAIARDASAAQVVAGIVGAAGLVPTLAAARAGKRILLANKEALVMSGRLLMDEVAAHGAELLPVDSEHNAIFQCLPATGENLDAMGVERILLTASGGPFRGCSREALVAVTPDQACAHPRWTMGRKISVDSATLMNKGLELIEACWLFDADPDRVQVVIHPQSIIHSLVAYVDGSVLAQMGNPDMRTPIAHALGWPDRVPAGVEPLDLLTCGSLDFEAPDEAGFPALGLAREAWWAGGTATTILNAANEEAVAAFLEHRLGFLQIPDAIREALDRVEVVAADSLEAVQEADRRAREAARGWIGEPPLDRRGLHG